MRAELSKLISFIAIATVLLTACGGGGDKKEDPKPDPDTEKPTIVTTLPIATSPPYGLGGTFAYKGTFTDNEELKQVVFSLSDNKQKSSAFLKVATGVDDEPWKPADVTVPLTGKKQTLEQGLFGGIPTTDIWTGTYTLTISCSDKAGNEAIFTVNVTIQ